MAGRRYRFVAVMVFVRRRDRASVCDVIRSGTGSRQHVSMVGSFLLFWGFAVAYPGLALCKKCIYVLFLLDFVFSC